MVKSTALQCPSFSCVVWRAVAVSSKTFHESQYFCSHTFWQSRTNTSRRLCSSWISTKSAQPLNLFSVWARNRTAGTSLCRTVSYLPLASGRVFVLILIVWLFNWPGCRLRAHFKFSVTIRWKFWFEKKQFFAQVLLLTGCRRNRNFPVGHEALGIHMNLYKTPCKKGLVSSPQCVRLGTVAAVCRDGSSSLLWTVWKKAGILNRFRLSRCNKMVEHRRNWILRHRQVCRS